MEMALCNAHVTFQTHVKLYFPCFNRQYYGCHLHDIIVFSRDWTFNLKHLEIVLDRLKEQQLYACPKKCQRMRDEVDYLAEIVNKNGTKMYFRKIKSTQIWRKPRSLKELREFIRLVQFSED